MNGDAAKQTVSSRDRSVSSSVEMIWPHLPVEDVDASLAFYRDTLGFEQALCLKDDNGKTYMGSVEVGHTVVMFERPDPKAPPMPERGARCGVGLSFLFPKAYDLDSLYAKLRGKPGIKVCREIGDRPWGNRDFGIRDPDGYYLVFCKASR